MFCWLRLGSFMTKKSFSLNIEAKIKHTQNVAFFFRVYNTGIYGSGGFRVSLFRLWFGMDGKFILKTSNEKQGDLLIEQI